jgi:hypothetical protein
MRPLVSALLVVCIVTTALLGALFAHHTRPGWLDATLDARIQADLDGHLALLNYLAGLGNLVPVIVMTGALFLACLVTR